MNANPKLILTTLLVLLAAATEARAATVKFCFEYDTYYTDNGIVGEA